MIGNRLQLDRGPQIGSVFKELLNAAIVPMEKLFQYQAGEELRLRVCLGTIFMRIVRQRKLANQVPND